MVNKLVSIRFSESILDDVESLSESEGYSNIQEFIRHSVRDAVQRHKLQQSILALEKLSGTQKISAKSKKEINRHIKKVFG
jgi:Arc/MetJ-type ribon-helix-helix transcriptional regulator